MAEPVSAGLRTRLLGAVRRQVPRFPQRRHVRGRNLVLLYHRIGPLSAPDPMGMTVTPENFAAHLDAVASEHDVVPLEQIRRIGGRPAIAITFDDGYADNVEVAAPALRRRSLPASFYVTTTPWTDGREFWWDRLEHLVLEDSAGGAIDVRLGSSVVNVRLGTADERRAALKTLGRAMMPHHPGTVEQALSELARRPGASEPACHTHRRMTREQVSALAQDPLFSIGSHTCSHSCLRALSPDESAFEMSDSRRRLAEVLGSPPDVLAFPYGAVGTLRRSHLRQAHAAGYTGALLNVPGPAESAPAMAVPRLTVGDGDAESLLASMRRWQRPAP